MRDVFAYRLRVLEAVTANAAMPLVAGEDVRSATRGFSGRLWDWAFSNPAVSAPDNRQDSAPPSNSAQATPVDATTNSDRADYDSGDRAIPAACHGFREVAKSGAQPEPARLRRLCVVPAFGLRPRLCTKLVTRREDQSASSERLYNLLVVGRPLQLSRWVEAVPASTGRLTWKNPLADR